MLRLGDRVIVTQHKLSDREWRVAYFVGAVVMVLHHISKTVYGLGWSALALPPTWLSLKDSYTALACFYPCSWIILEKAGNVQVRSLHSDYSELISGSLFS